MQIRRKSDPEFEAIQADGDLNKLVTWLVNRIDFAAIAVGNDLSMLVTRSNGTGMNLVTGDYIRVKEDNTLDRIKASNFATDWEIVPTP